MKREDGEGDASVTASALSAAVCQGCNALAQRHFCQTLTS